MEQIILIIHVIVSIFLIVLVLVQHGKGADAGAAFGGGASQTVFGSQGSGSFLMKITCLLAFIFFVTCIVLGNMASNAAHNRQGLGLVAPTSSTHVVPVKSTDTKSATNKAVLPAKTSTSDKQPKRSDSQ